MDREYDYAVLGTGVKECLLSGLLSVHKYSVLMMDRNGYYGAESASLSLEDVYKKFRGKDAQPPKELGRSNKYMIDLTPKLIMANGDMVKTLLSTGVNKYLSQWKTVGGSFVYKNGSLFKVPVTPKDALSSSLLGMMEKFRIRSFLSFVSTYDYSDKKTWEALRKKGWDPKKTPMKTIYEYYCISENIQEFFGHAVCLYLDDGYKAKAAHECLERGKLYAYSLARFGKSPYIYPQWGLGGLPEGFSRLCAVHGGVFMLNKPMVKLHYGEDGKVAGVEAVKSDDRGNHVAGETETVKVKNVIADPTYFIKEKQPDMKTKEFERIKKTGYVGRWIFLLKNPIPNTENASSCQIIMPAKQVPGRKSDIYISCVSHEQKIAPKPVHVVMISGNVSSDDEKTAKSELKVARALVGKALQEFFEVSPLYAPSGEVGKDNVWISSSYDATSHWQTTISEVLAMFTKMTGKKVDLNKTITAEDLKEGQC